MKKQTTSKNCWKRIEKEAPLLAKVIRRRAVHSDDSLLAKVDKMLTKSNASWSDVEITSGVLIRVPKPADDGSGKRSVVIDSNRRELLTLKRSDVRQEN